MTLHNISPLNGTPVGLPNIITWSGGSAQLHMQRLHTNFRFPEEELHHLSLEERLRLKTKTRVDKANRALAARLKLRKMLSEVLACQPNEIQFVTDAEGRPGLHPQHGIERSELDFSISYGPMGFAVAISHGQRVGLDIEHFAPSHQESFLQIFGDTMQERGIDNFRPQELWVRMEAYGKLQGEGLGYGMRKLFDIAIEPEKAPIPCKFFDFRFGLGTSGSVCLSGSPEELICLSHGSQYTALAA